MLDHRRHARAVERGQLLRARDLPDEPSVLHDALRGQLHGRVEIRLHLERLPEIGIVVVQEPVDVLVADHADLDAAGNRLGLEDGGREHEDRVVGLDFQDAVAEGSLERRPDARLLQHILGVQDDVAAVRADKGARLDPHVVCAPLPRAIHRLLDRAEEVLVAGGRLVDDGRPLCRRVVDQEVHSVLEERIGGLGPGLSRGLILLAPEPVEPQEDPLLQLVEENTDRIMGERPAHLHQRVVDDGQNQVHVQLLETALGFLVRIVDLLEDALHRLGEGVVPLLDFPELGRRVLALGDKVLELLDLHRVARDDGHEARTRDRPHLDLDENEVLLLDLLLEGLDHGLLPLAVSLDEGLSLARVLVGLEDRGDTPLQPFDVLLHGLAEPRALTGRQDEEPGAVRVLEVVDVDEVRRRGPLAGADLEKTVDRRVAARPDMARDENVESLGLDLQPQPYRLGRTVLPDDPVRRLQLVGRCKREHRRVADSSERFGFQRFDGAAARHLGDSFRWSPTDAAILSPRPKPPKRSPHFRS